MLRTPAGFGSPTREDDLKSAYGEEGFHLKRIGVRVIYKDITVEMLRDKDFANEAKKATLDLNKMYEEYQAARVRE